MGVARSDQSICARRVRVDTVDAAVAYDDD
jgi:hypothetical protein